MRASAFLLLLSTSTAAAEPLQATLGDMGAPVVVTFRGSGERELVIRSAGPRTIEVRAFREAKLHADHAWRRSWAMTVDGTASLRLASDAPTEAEHTVIVFDPKTVFDERHVYGAPAADSPLEHHVVGRYAPALGTSRPQGAAVVRPWFTTLAETFFVYAAEKSSCGATDLVAGEPLILLSWSTMNSRLVATLLRANGERADCLQVPFDRITTKRPAKVAMPPPTPAPTFWSQTLDDEEFLALADKQPRIAKYVALKEKAKECSTKQWDKLDPDGRAYRYDLVTYDKNGNVQQVESYKLKLTRKVDAACKLQRLRDERDAIRQMMAKEFVLESRAAIDAAAKRFN